MNTGSAIMTLWVPALFGSRARRNSVLARLLARGRFVPSPGGPPERLLFHLFLLDSDPLPFAAVTHAADTGTADDATWLRVDPVHLALGAQQAFLADPAMLGLSIDEARELGAALVPVFEAQGYHLEIPHPARWYTRLPTPAAIRTTPLAQAVGRDVGPLLPSGDGRRAWHRLMTEAQMVLHGAAVNEAREAQGREPINSVWPWGEGCISRTPAVWSSVRADDVLIRGLAQASGCAPAPAPSGVADVFAADPTGRHLMAPLGAMDRDRFEDEWLVPLFSALRADTLPTLALADGTAVLTVNSREARRWWRLGGFDGRH
ncbi:MAG: hypothetical protein ACYCQK_06455 [Acidiferrobacteraceae bacterium]